jgi:hypothetical protein
VGAWVGGSGWWAGLGACGMAGRVVHHDAQSALPRSAARFSAQPAAHCCSRPCLQGLVELTDRPSIQKAIAMRVSSQAVPLQTHWLCAVLLAPLPHCWRRRRNAGGRCCLP